MSYTKEEYFEMLLVYGQCNRNAAATVREYATRFPNRRQPDVHVILRLVHRAINTGSFTTTRVGAAGAPRYARQHQVEEAIIEAVDEDPTRSVRTLAVLCGASRSSTHRIMRENLLHPYHYTRVQHMQPTDYPARLQFCQWLLSQNDENAGFSRNILFTDECSFSREGMFNARNWHFWADENPHITRVRAFQERFSVNVWAGIVGNNLVGPFRLQQRLNGQEYARFLIQDLPGLLEDIPLNIRQNMWFQHDGAPAHNARISQEALAASYPNKWIGRGGTIPWPPRSPDLTCLDFFLWGHLKEYVYREPLATIEDLEARLQEAIATVTPEMLQNVQNNLLRRAAACVQMDGRHFEHLL